MHVARQIASLLSSYGRNLRDVLSPSSRSQKSEIEVSGGPLCSLYALREGPPCLFQLLWLQPFLSLWLHPSGLCHYLQGDSCCVCLLSCLFVFLDTGRWV